MPQRFLRPGITTSERWNSVSFEAQSFYIRILTLVDDFGRYDARIPILHGQCFALRSDIKAQRTAALRSELQSSNLVVIYVFEEREYLQVTQWQERARSDKSKFPDPPTESQDSAADGSGAQYSAASLVPRPSPSTIAITPSPARKRRAAKPPLECEEFAQFWAQYPKKAGKENAEEAWVERGCSIMLPQILFALRKCKISRDWTKEGGQFIPHPAKWLNRRGWEDELLPSNGRIANENIKPNIIRDDS